MVTLDSVLANLVLKMKEIVMAIVNVRLVSDVETIVQIHLVLTLTLFVVIMPKLLEMQVFAPHMTLVKLMKVIVIPMKNVKVISFVAKVIVLIILVSHHM